MRWLTYIIDRFRNFLGDSIPDPNTGIIEELAEGYKSSTNKNQADPEHKLHSSTSTMNQEESDSQPEVLKKELTPADIDPICTPLPEIYEVQEQIFFDIDSSITNVVRILRLHEADEAADTLKATIPVLSKLYFDNEINTLIPKFFDIGYTTQFRRLNYWEYEWIQWGRWKRRFEVRNTLWEKISNSFNYPAEPDVKLIERCETARKFLNLDHAMQSYDDAFRYVACLDLELGPNPYLIGEAENEKEQLQYLKSRLLLKETMFKVTDFEYAMLYAFQPSSYSDVLSDSEYASLIHTQFLKNIDVNLLASVVNKLEDPIMLADLVEVDSFSIRLLTDLSTIIDSFQASFDFVDQYAKQLKIAKDQHDHDMARAKVLDHLNEQIKPLDKYRDGFQIEDIETPKDN